LETEKFWEDDWQDEPEIRYVAQYLVLHRCSTHYDTTEARQRR